MHAGRSQVHIAVYVEPIENNAPVRKKSANGDRNFAVPPVVTRCFTPKGEETLRLSVLLCPVYDLFLADLSLVRRELFESMLCARVSRCN